MKSKRRHELQQNDLADWLAHKIERGRPYLTMVASVLVAVVAVYAVYWAASSWSRSQTAEAWSQYYAATTASADVSTALRTVVEGHEGTPPGILARHVLATVQMREAGSLLLTNQVEARRLLRSSADEFARLIAEAREPLLRQNSTFQLARCLETLGELDSARSRYQEVIDQWPDSSFAQAAERHLATLNEDSTAQWYTWFATARPPAPGVQPLDVTEPDGDLLQLPTDPLLPRDLFDNLLDGLPPAPGLPSDADLPPDADVPLESETPPPTDPLLDGPAFPGFGDEPPAGPEETSPTDPEASQP